jgi:hypothetical protein
MFRRTRVFDNARGVLVALGAFAAAQAGFALTHTALAQDFDINQVFYCNEGEPTGEQSPEECVAARESIFTNCTSCHSFVPAVKAQKTPQEWDATLQTHKTRIETLTDADFEQIGKFLKSHFNPENPVPQLPPELEALTDLPPA